MLWRASGLPAAFAQTAALLQVGLIPASELSVAARVRTALLRSNEQPTLRRSLSAQVSANATRAITILFAILMALTAALGVLHAALLPNEALPGDIERMGVGVALLFLVEAALAVAVVAKLSASRRADAAVRDNEERMMMASEAAQMGLWHWDIVNNRFWLTPRARHLLDVGPEEEFTTATWEERIHPEDRTRLFEALGTAMADDFDVARTYEFEYRITLPNRGTRWIRVRGRSRRGADGGPVTDMTGTIADITDTKQMRADLEKQHTSLLHLSRVSVLGVLSGALAHELRQPLTAIMSNAQAAERLLAQGRIHADDLRAAIKDIIADNTRASSVIARLRALLQNGEARHEPVELNELIDSSLDLMQNDMTRRRVTVVKKLSTDPLPIRGDAVQLQQLLLNLFLNASEAMSSEASGGGTLVVSSDADNEKRVHVAISDTGPGISPELASTLFEPLVTNKPDGLGLGLSVCRAIVGAHGGLIWAQNNAGRGATIHVDLPKPQVRAAA